MSRSLTFMAVALALAGCIEPVASDPGLPAMCEVDSDCDSGAGEICDEGICWGDPPESLEFAAVLMPPSDRSDLAPTEVTSLEISRDGTVTGLGFAPTIVVSGRVVLACSEGLEDRCGPEHPIAAQVVAERESSFVGGPSYSRAVTARSDVGAGEPSFALRLPADGSEYRISVVPDDAELSLEAGGTSTAGQAPPVSTTIVADRDREIVFELGDPDELKTLAGCVENSLGNGSAFAGMHATVLGRWTELGKLERASAVVLLDDDGCFVASVPIAMADVFDVVVKPPPGVALPSLRLAGELVPDPIEGVPELHRIAPLIMPNTPSPTLFRLPIVGLGSGGASTPVAGAELRFVTEFSLGDLETRDLSISFTAQAVSNGRADDAPGVAEVALYPGSFEINRRYTVHVVPPPESEFAAKFDLEVAVGTGEGAPVLEAVTLSRRIAVTGSFATADGTPLSSTPVEVELSPITRGELAEIGLVTVADSLQFPTDTTGSKGDVFMWLDRELLGVSALYDFDLAPPLSSAAPRWTFEAVSIGDAVDSIDLEAMRLPEASYARGVITGPGGSPVAGAELRLYELPGPELCQRSDAGPFCAPEAKLRGIWEANADGRITAVLPDP